LPDRENYRTLNGTVGSTDQQESAEVEFIDSAGVDRELRKESVGSEQHYGSPEAKYEGSAKVGEHKRST
jgi:hypothetical protein